MDRDLDQKEMVIDSRVTGDLSHLPAGRILTPEERKMCLLAAEKGFRGSALDLLEVNKGKKPN